MQMLDNSSSETVDKISISLLVSTYNSPEYLALSLKSVLMQSRMPDEVVIADDGSGDETKEVIDEFRKECPVPVKHVWHPDDGFRLSAIRNKALKSAAGDYIIQIDGDIVMDPDFVKDHERYAVRGCFTGASRAFVSEDFSNEMRRSQQIDYAKLYTHSINKLNALRLPWVTPFFTGRNRKKTTIRGCNMAYWRSDAFRINGYNEDFKGWGSEDCEFAVRLSNSGLRKQWLKFAAIEYHLYHKTNDASNKDVNRIIMENALNDNLTIITNGIDKLT